MRGPECASCDDTLLFFSVARACCAIDPRCGFLAIARSPALMRRGRVAVDIKVARPWGEADAEAVELRGQSDLASEPRCGAEERREIEHVLRFVGAH